MRETDDVIEVGDPMPTVGHVEPADGSSRLRVKWAQGRRRGEEVVDIAPQLGISRRLVACYAKDRDVPRYISLPCEALRERNK